MPVRGETFGLGYTINLIKAIGETYSFIVELQISVVIGASSKAKSFKISFENISGADDLVI